MRMDSSRAMTSSSIPFFPQEILHARRSLFSGQGQGGSQTEAGQHPGQPAHGQAHHVVVVPVDALHQHGPVALNAVGPALSMGSPVAT